MRLHRLEVKHFRGIREASVTFGRGLTVLHGPNELGKSSLVEAIRAALFLQTTSSAGEEHVTWGESMPACVTLTFEHTGKLWRVEKRFGHRRMARLACSDCVEAPRFRDVAEGNHVEGTLRDLLAWGIAPPGGRGAGPKLESYLLTALVGRQGEVQGIFDASLAKDKDDTGKALVTRALGALDKDPVVTGIVETLTKRVDQVFTSRDRRLKTSADSPLFTLLQSLRTQEELLRDLQDADRKGTDVRANVVRLQDARLRLLGEVEAAAASAHAAGEQSARATARAGLRREVEALQRQLADIDAQLAALTTREGELAVIESDLERAWSAERAAAAAVEAVRQRLQTSTETVARASEAFAQSSHLADQSRARRRAELHAQRTVLEARLKDVAATEQAAAEAADLQQACAHADGAVVDAAERVREAGITLERARTAAQLVLLAQRHEVVARAATALDEAQRREADARAQLETAGTAVIAAQRRRDAVESASDAGAIAVAQSELTLLRAVEAHLARASLRDEIRSLEAAEERARRHRADALAARARAMDVEQRLAARVLPTAERIAAWRLLERELAARPLPDRAESSSPLVPGVVGLVAGVAVAAAAHLALALPMAVAGLSGLLAAAIGGGLAWFLLQGRYRAQSHRQEQLRRRRDRWVQEVEPSLRAAGLPNLAAFEGAVAALVDLRAEAQHLRAEADKDDASAVDAERAAAALQTRRATLERLERETPAADTAAVAERMQAFGADAAAVQRRIALVAQELDATRARVKAEADQALRAATEIAGDAQTNVDRATRNVAACETALRLARDQADPDTMTRLRARLQELGDDDVPALPVEAATDALDLARQHLAALTAEAGGLRRRLDEARRAADRRVAALGTRPGDARQEAEQGIEAIGYELSTLESSPMDEAESAATALQRARDEHARLEGALAGEQEALDGARRRRVDAERCAADVRTDIASRRGTLNAVDRNAIEARLLQATSDPVFADGDDAALDPEAARASLVRLQRQLEQCTADLNQATGQLTLIAGHVGSERLAQLEEAVTYARAEVLERELNEKAALRLLREIAAVEASRATHLGRVLAGPVSRAFKQLTRDRYGQVAFAPDLTLQHVEADGGERRAGSMSIGTREQLATLLRLAIAGHLRTAVVLDDQLVHSDSARLAWFGDRLRASVRDHGHQVIVFTCRAADYLPSGAAPDDTQVTIVDLSQHIRRDACR